MHYIRAVTLEKLILDNLKQVVQLAQEDEQEFVRRLTSRSIQEQKVQVQSLQKELAQKNTGPTIWITSSSGCMRTP